MAHNATNSPMGMDSPNAAKPCPTSASSTYLAIPAGRMARTASHESFATDVSLLSLSSFTSEIPTRTHHSSYDKDDDPDSDRCDQALAKYREDMFEKMLETHALTAMPRLNAFGSSSKGRGSSNQPDTIAKAKSGGNNRFRDLISGDRKINANGLTESEEELLRKCAEDGPRVKGSLYKSFSTSDVLSLGESIYFRAQSLIATAEIGDRSIDPNAKQQAGNAMKSCASQSWIPNDYARAAQRRRTHLEYLKKVCVAGNLIDDEWNFMCKEDFEADPNTESIGDDLSQGAHTPDTAGPGDAANRQNRKRANRKSRAEPMITSQNDNRRSNSEENLSMLEPRWNSAAENAGASKQTLLKKLNFSKEIGCRIRDDLMQKMNKHKRVQQQTSVTKSDLEREKGRPLTRLERNYIIFHWLQSLDDDSFANA